MKILALFSIAALALLGTGCTECNKGQENALCVALGDPADGSSPATDTAPSADARPEDSTRPRDDEGNGDVGTEDAHPEDAQPGDAANDAQVPPHGDVGAGGSDGHVSPPTDVGTTDALPPRDGLPPTDGPMLMDGPLLIDGPIPVDGPIMPDGPAPPDGAMPIDGPPLVDGPMAIDGPPPPDGAVPPPDGPPVCVQSLEICDGQDNNCDGNIDEDGVCVTPEDAGADAASDAAPDAGITDATPLDGAIPDATAADAAPICTPSNEIDPTCDGIDDNCDGQIDEDFQSNPTTCGVGNCASAGETQCQNGREIDSCQVGNPVAELCDGQDNNCNSLVDDNANVACNCPLLPGVPFTQQCVGGVLQPCPCPQAEVCDGFDNDLNGHIDDVPGAGEPCTSGQGECMANGTQQCRGNLLACNAVASQPNPELCDGLDNNCDGAADEGFGLGEACDVSTGACLQHGTQVCGMDGQVICSAQAGQPTVETCNGIDDNCDGEEDNNPTDVGTVCHEGVGACESAGTTVCTDGGIRCDATPGQPVAETCNEIDDDCDGQVDEICPGRVNIPAGNVVNRSNQAVPLGAFWIGRNEATVADYAACVSAGTCSLPSQGASYNWSIQGKENYPINGVSWQQARTYCQWTGGDLPSDLQWIKGARDSTGANYPWGLAPPPDCARSQIGSCLPFESVQVGIHSPTGDSPYGITDMVGNVEEWTTVAAGPPNTRLVAGGSWRKNPGEPGLRVIEMIGRVQADPSDTIGFRCVWPAQ